MRSCLPELRPLLRPQRRPARSPSAAQLHLLSPRGTDASPAIWNRLPVSTSLIRHLISYFLRKCLFSPLSLLHPVLKYLFASASLQSWDCPRDPEPRDTGRPRTQGRGQPSWGSEAGAPARGDPSVRRPQGLPSAERGRWGQGRTPAERRATTRAQQLQGRWAGAPGASLRLWGAPSSPHSPPC